MSVSRAVEIWGVVAEFATHAGLVAAARRAREAGYRRVDAYSPFPIDGLDEALGFHRAWRVALIALLGGLVGAGGGYLLQYYLMVIAYPLNVGGRPLHSWPAFVPVTFELMVLCAALSAVIGLFILNGLPLPHHPLFGVPRFARATQDGLFLSIEATDPKFERETTRRFLQRLGAVYVSDVPDD